MKKEVLLTYFAIGPTFRERVLYNINSNLSSYMLVDLLILTDIVEDFKVLTKYGNIKIIKLDDLRKDHPWSLQYEALPLGTKSEADYAADLIENQKYFSFSLWRFVLLIEGIDEYKALFFANCDVLFCLPEDKYDVLLKALDFNTENNAVGNGLVNYSDIFGDLAKSFTDETNRHYDEALLSSNDGNLFGYCFKDKTKLKSLFEVMDSIIYKTVVEKSEDYWQLGQHCIWSTNNEPIQAIAYSLLDINSYPGSELLHSAFSIQTHPEDRFWSWSSGDFITSQISKQDFININYDRLKKMYADKQQQWIYD